MSYPLAISWLVWYAELLARAQSSQLAGLRLVRSRLPLTASSLKTALPASAAAAPPRIPGQQERSTEVDNHKDTQFAIEVKLGGQRLHVMLDTGSFRLTVLSKQCSQTECPHGAFDPAASKTYQQLAHKTKSLFGSGQLWAQDASDELQFASYGPQRQKFWEISKLDSNMHELWSQTEFDGILGLSWRKTVPDAENETTVLEHLEVDAFTVCLGRSARWSSVESSGREVQVSLNGAVNGTPSRVYWGRRDEHHLGHFVHMDVIGNQHWAVNLSDVSVRYKMQGLQKLACWDQPCAAVIDTGSSVLSAPKLHLSRLRRLLGVQLGCGNFNDLPDLHFHLGGKGAEAGMDIVLPARSYVKHVRLNVVNSGDHPSKQSASDLTEMCQPRLGDSSFLNTDIAVWILGVPFLQEYVCQFDRSKSPAQVGIAAHPGVCPSASGPGIQPESGERLGALSVASKLKSRVQKGVGTVLAEERVTLPDVRELLGVHE